MVVEGGDGGPYYGALLFVFFPLDSVSLENKTTDKTGHCERDEARETASAQKISESSKEESFLIFI